MAPPGPRKADTARWRGTIVSHLADFPRQYAALENALAAFGDNFERLAFKAAFDTTEDMEAYNRVQAVERSMGRVEHSYLGAPAGDVHRATQLVHAAARDFIAAYRPWIEPLLKPD